MSTTQELSTYEKSLVFFDAACKENFDTIKELCKNGFDVNTRNMVGHTALYHAITTMNLQLCQCLTDLGADWEMRGIDGQKYIDIALDIGFFDNVITDSMNDIAGILKKLADK